MAEGSHRLSSVWCVPAARTGIVLVLARYTDGGRGWTHLMRWKPGRRPEPGAWARLNVVKHLCRVDPSGVFLKYEAKKRHAGEWNAPGPQHFRGSVGGGMAVSRSPWLSALTDVEGLGVMGGGGGDSKHALSRGEQERLWAMFPPVPLDDDIPWLVRQQPGWREVHGLVTWHGSILRSLHGLAWYGEHALKEGGGSLLVRLPMRERGWYREASTVRYTWRDPSGCDWAMEGVAWGWIRPDGGLLVATREGVLRWLVRRAKAEGDEGWMSWWKVRESHDCSMREPEPGPSPAWARAGLG